MKLAILSDIHSNLEALEAAFEHFKGQNIDAIYCTGDLVGYAASPNEVIDLIRKNKVKCVLGNHDLACFDKHKTDVIHGAALEAIIYTLKVITPENFLFLKSLPSYLSENGLYIVHGIPPKSVHDYIDCQYKAEIIKAFSAFPSQVAFVGHTHLFEVYELTENRKLVKFSFMDEPVDLNPASKYIVTAGSVGQPRWPHTEAGYLIYDTDKQQITKRDLKYDVQLTIRKINDAGLPEKNGTRLLKIY